MFNLLWILVLAGHWSGSFGLSARNLKSSSAKSEDECSVGDGCKKYCEGWQESKSLFYITSCPSRHKGEGFCKDMQCIHTSESSADTAGCYCCCGDEASASSVYHGPQGNFRVSEPNSRTRYISSGRQNSPNGCWVGSGCKEYCKGWHESKPLFFISSCPVEFGKRQCGDLKCEHTSESSADSDGCFCCCGEDPSPETVFYGPLSEVHRISGDEALPPPETRDCNQPAFVLGMRAGRAACTRLGMDCSGAEVNFDMRVEEEQAQANRLFCSTEKKGECLTKARVYPQELEFGCADAIRQGYGRCNSNSARSIFESYAEFFCGAL